MQTNLIPIIDFCTYHQIETTFIQSLEEFGLLQTTEVQKKVCVNIDELEKLEKYLRLFQEMNINLEGLHAVAHLLELLQQKDDQILALKNELSYFNQIQ